MQGTLEQAVLLELLPGSELEVFIQVLQADGGERTACINAAVLAVANAGDLFSLLIVFSIHKLSENAAPPSLLQT